MNPKTIILSSLLLAPLLARAGILEQQLLHCSSIADPSVRLGCFDALARPPAGADSAAAPVVAPAADASALPAPAATASAAPVTAPPAKPAALSRTVQLWEADDGARRGTFAFRPHRDNYLLLANYNTAANDDPFRGFAPAGITSQHTELTYQLSFKMKLAERIAGSPVDLWFGYTQQSFWQAYNRSASSPFRETNYQPELMLLLPLKQRLGGFELSYVNFGLVHQSNGQTSTLSRSWNRVYGELGAERGELALSARLWKRLDNAKSDNDNPDITDYLGNGDLRASYRHNGHEYSLLARRNFHARHGALQADWAFPIAANLKGYLLLFSGYGQSLIDYNYSHKSLGAGFLIDF